MRKRRHHNNQGLRQIKRGKTQQQVEAMARRLQWYTGSAERGRAICTK